MSGLAARAVLYALAFGAGVALTVQVGVNAAARGYLRGNAASAALLSFVTGGVALALYVAVSGGTWLPRSALAAPAWVWAGGVLGAAYVLASMMLGPRLGALAFFSLVILGQLASSVLVDHFGLLGFPRAPLSAGRLLGLLALMLGAWLINR